MGPVHEIGFSIKGNKTCNIFNTVFNMEVEAMSLMRVWDKHVSQSKTVLSILSVLSFSFIMIYVGTHTKVQKSYTWSLKVNQS